MSKKYFRWLGGKLIFDFYNTVLIHSESTLELLETKDDLMRWFSNIGYDNVEITSQILEDVVNIR